MLFNPLEKQFDLPAAFVECADCGGRNSKIVGQEDERLRGLAIVEADAPQMVGVMLAGIVTVERDGLIADDADCTVARCRIHPMGVHVRFGPGDEEGAELMEPVQTGEIDITAIHNVDGAWFREQKVKRVDVMQLAIRDVDEARDAAAQIQERVHLHRGFGRAEMGPGEDRQAQVDGRRVERIDGAGEIQPEILFGIELPSLADQSLGQFGMNAPVAPFIGIGQRRATHRFAETHAIELRRLNRQTGLDVAQALPVGQLRESHGPILFGARKRPHTTIAAIARNDPRERAPRQESISWANSVLPAFTGTSSETIRSVPDCVQIDITQFHRKLIENHAIVGHSQPLNRTPVTPLISRPNLYYLVLAETSSDFFLSMRASLARPLIVEGTLRRRAPSGSD